MLKGSRESTHFQQPLHLRWVCRYLKNWPNIFDERALECFSSHIVPLLSYYTTIFLTEGLKVSGVYHLPKESCRTRRTTFLPLLFLSHFKSSRPCTTVFPLFLVSLQHTKLNSNFIGDGQTNTLYTDRHTRTHTDTFTSRGVSYVHIR